MAVRFRLGRRAYRILSYVAGKPTCQKMMTIFIGRSALPLMGPRVLPAYPG